MIDFPEFAWSVGEEGSDPLVDVDGETFRHDQYRQSGHYDHMQNDLDDVAALGVELVRYGMPWRLAEPEANRYNWRLWDRALDACAAAGLTPIVDLLHFGLPDHYPGFVDSAWIDGFVRYTAAFLDRYPEVMFFTPVNEPGITALMSARFGLWNDRLTSREAHAVALANVVRANLEAIALIRQDRNGWWIGSEGFDVAIDMTGDNAALVDRQRATQWLVWDLHFGHEPLPAALGYLDAVDDKTLTRISELAVTDRLIAGLDFYPTSVRMVGGDANLSVGERIDSGMDAVRIWHDRYQEPFWVAETSNLSLPTDKQILWLDSLVAGLTTLSDDGLPVRGLCWYSRGDQFDWQTGLAQPVGAVTEVGLFDAHRVARPVAARFAEYASR